MNVELNAKTVTSMIKTFLRALETAEDVIKHQERSIDRLQADNDHMAQEIKNLETSLNETRTQSEGLMRQMDDANAAHAEYQKTAIRLERDLLNQIESAPVAQSPSKPCPKCGATPWGQNKVCPSCQVVRHGP